MCVYVCVGVCVCVCVYRQFETRRPAVCSLPASRRSQPAYTIIIQFKYARLFQLLTVKYERLDRHLMMLNRVQKYYYGEHMHQYEDQATKTMSTSQRKQSAMAGKTNPRVT